MNLALVSLDQVWENKTENLKLCEKYILKASNANVDLIAFPEMTLTGFSTNVASISEDKNNSKTVKKFSELAKKHQIGIIFGAAVHEEDKYVNNCFFISSEGALLKSYSKIHPFTFANEDKYFNPGDQLEIVNYHELNFGLSICYDLRFPELYSALAKKSDMIFNIANWPNKRLDHWHSLLKARAIENQCYIAGVNRIGTDGNKLLYTESSVIFNANGEQVKYTTVDDMKIFAVDKSWTQEFKASFSTTNDRKNELYKMIL